MRVMKKGSQKYHNIVFTSSHNFFGCKLIKLSNLVHFKLAKRVLTGSIKILDKSE